MPEDKPCKNVAPKNLIKIIAVAFEIGIRGVFRRINKFSTAAKPNAAIIQYNIASNGSSNSEFFKTLYFTTEYFKYSSTTAGMTEVERSIPITEVGIFVRISEIERYGFINHIKKNSNTIASGEIIIPQIKILITIEFGSGWESLRR